MLHNAEPILDGPEAGVLESIAGRAAAAVRRMVSARDGLAGETSAIVRTCQDLQSRVSLAEAEAAEATDRARRAEAERDAALADLERARADAARFLEAGHEALRQARGLQRERDEAREMHAALLEAARAGGATVPPVRRTAAALPVETVAVEAVHVPAPPLPVTPPRVALRGPAPSLEDEIRQEVARAGRAATRPAHDGVACLEESDRASIARAVEGFVTLVRPRARLAGATG